MSVPESVLASWEERAEKNDEARVRWHEKHHFWVNMETCFKCQRLVAICKSKMRFDTLEAAQEIADRKNSPRNDAALLVPYCCYWTDGLHWHNATAHTASDIRKARKRMSRLLR